MKTLIFTSLFSLLLLGLSGCSSEELLAGNDNDEMQTVSFFISIDDSAVNNENGRTRAFSDGELINIERYVYVYNQANGANAEPLSVLNILDMSYDIDEDNKTSKLNLSLAKGNTYDVIFLATAVPQDDKDQILYYSPKDRTLKVNYDKIASNDDAVDCFFTCLHDVTVEYSPNYYVELKRPFAQINIGSMDYANYNSSSNIKNISVSVSGVYDTFSLMDGSVIGEPVTADFLAAPVPTREDFALSGYSLLSMSYVLVNTRKLVDVSMTVNHVDSSVSPLELSFPNVAVERNYQTNIHGKELLTNPVTQ